MDRVGPAATAGPQSLVMTSTTPPWSLRRGPEPYSRPALLAFLLSLNGASESQQPGSAGISHVEEERWTHIIFVNILWQVTIWNQTLGQPLYMFTGSVTDSYQDLLLSFSHSKNTFTKCPKSSSRVFPFLVGEGTLCQILFWQGQDFWSTCYCLLSLICAQNVTSLEEVSERKHVA